MFKYDLGVYIGRFQPYHLGHKYTVDLMLDQCDKALVLIGSANASRSTKNPFTYLERASMVSKSHPAGVAPRLKISPLKDFPSDPAWIEEVGRLVSEHSKEGAKIAIFGHSKDETSYYLDYFKHWEEVEVPKYPEKGNTIDATKVRELLFNKDYSFINSAVSPEVAYFLGGFITSKEYENLVEDYKHIKDYKKSWSAAPFPPIFVTTDAVVVQSGHILLVERGQSPGKGLMALPGGFIDEKESLLDCVVRELREETLLKVPEKVLKGSIQATKVFDKPERSTRGRTITHAYLFKLDDSEKLPKVKGSDDAAKAVWVPLTSFVHYETKMYEDHFHIANYLMSQLETNNT